MQPILPCAYLIDRPTCTSPTHPYRRRVQGKAEAKRLDLNVGGRAGPSLVDGKDYYLIEVRVYDSRGVSHTPRSCDSAIDRDGRQAPFGL